MPEAGDPEPGSVRDLLASVGLDPGLGEAARDDGAERLRYIHRSLGHTRALEVRGNNGAAQPYAVRSASPAELSIPLRL
jgi:hypothetical protein